MLFIDNIFMEQFYNILFMLGKFLFRKLLLFLIGLYKIEKPRKHYDMINLSYLLVKSLKYRENIDIINFSPVNSFVHTQQYFDSCEKKCQSQMIYLFLTYF